MTIICFEEIKAWQLAREMCLLVRNWTEREAFAKDWALKKQIRSASGSTMDCLAEGFERGSRKEFLYFLGIAKGSCGELRSQGYRALDYGYISEEERLALHQLSCRTSAAIQGLIRYLQKTEAKGQRYLDYPTPSKYPSPDFPTEPPPV